MIDAAIWSRLDYSRVPYRLYHDAALYAREQEAIFRGPVWNYLALDAEIPNPGDFRAAWVGDTPVIVNRDRDGEVKAFVNRCAHRGALVRRETAGNASEHVCIYHQWCYGLDGGLTAIPFRRGVRGKGGLDPSFDMSRHGLQRLRVDSVNGAIFGTLADDAEPLETYLGPEIAQGIRRVLHRPPRILGRNTQTLHNNWKLYVENVKDSYHASLLHLFFTTFRLNRLSQKGGIVVDESGGNHISYSMIDRAAAADADYGAASLRSNDEGFRLRDPSILDSVDEFGDGITLQILSVFPGFVLQQIQNAIAIRLVWPRGVDLTDLEWVYLGFESDDEAMTERRLRQGNLVGAAGYISLEDGAVGSFVQRAVRGVDEDSGVIMMGGHGAESQPFRATETSVRGFWKKYRALMGA
jgi:phenylpropionate dioxygenase-like ring-hydroxylating dioxygenase large terminal subunit